PALESPLLGWNLSGLPDLQTATRPGGRCSLSSGTRVESGCRRASRRRRATCRRMALLRDARHGGLLPPPRACERGVRDARTASLPDALPARLLGHARSVAALRVRTLPRHRDRGPRGHSRLLEKPRSSEPSLLGPLAPGGSRVAPPHRLRSPDPCPRFSPDRRLADDPRRRSKSPLVGTAPLPRLRPSSGRPTRAVDAPATFRSRDGRSRLGDKERGDRPPAAHKPSLTLSFRRRA